jgi:hemoglobin
MTSLLALLAAAAVAAPQAPPPGEQPVDPYVVSDANAGATPMVNDALYRALHDQAGITRIVDQLIAASQADPRISDIFKGQDLVRLRRTLVEQICYISGGPCHYTGRDMKTAHKDIGLQTRDFNALVENLQTAMDKEGVPFAMQNRLLAKLAPMQRTTVTR